MESEIVLGFLIFLDKLLEIKSYIIVDIYILDGLIEVGLKFR